MNESEKQAFFDELSDDILKRIAEAWDEGYKAAATDFYLWRNSTRRDSNPYRRDDQPPLRLLDG